MTGVQTCALPISHPDTEEEGSNHSHNIQVPEKMRSVGAGDRVLVAWVQSEAVVIDIIERS